MLIKNMEYLSQRLNCTDAEKDACLGTVTAILHFWTDTRKNGLLAIGGDRAEQDPNPFSAPACSTPSNGWAQRMSRCLRNCSLST